MLRLFLLALCATGCLARSAAAMIEYFQNDYYGALDIPPTATLAEIKQAYRSLSRQYHPDKPTGDVERFREIAQAYEILKNETLRKEYDDFITSLPARFRPKFGVPQHTIKEGLIFLLTVITLLKLGYQTARYYEVRRRVRNSLHFQQTAKKAAKEGLPPPVIDVRNADFPTWDGLFIITVIRAPYQFPIWFAQQIRIWRFRFTGAPLSEEDRKYLIMKHYGLTQQEYEKALAEAKQREESKQQQTRGGRRK